MFTWRLPLVRVQTRRRLQAILSSLSLAPPRHPTSVPPAYSSEPLLPLPRDQKPHIPHLRSCTSPSLVSLPLDSSPSLHSPCGLLQVAVHNAALVLPVPGLTPFKGLQCPITLDRCTEPFLNDQPCRLLQPQQPALSPISSLPIQA